MPRIPVGQEQQRINPSSPVAIADTNDARMMGKAFEGLGKATAQFGETLGRIEETERQVAFSMQKDRLTADSALALEEAKKSGDPDIATTYQKLYKEKSAKSINETEDPIVKERLMGYRDNVLYTGTTFAQVEQIRFKETQLVQNVNLAKNSKLDQVRSTPEAGVQLYQNFKKEVIEPVMSMPGIDSDRRAQMIAAADADFAQATVDGFLDKKNYKAAARLLNATAEGAPPINLEGTIKNDVGDTIQLDLNPPKGAPLSPEESRFMNSLPSELKDRLRQRIKSAAEGEGQMRLSDVTGKMRDIQAALQLGAPVDPATLKNMQASINSLPISGTAKKLLQDDFRVTIETAKFMNTVSGASPSDMKKMYDETKAKIGLDSADPTFNAESRAKAMNAIDSSVQAIMKNRMEDPAGAAMQSPALKQLEAAQKDGVGTQDFIMKRLGEQVRLGVPNDQLKVLTKGEAQTLGRNLKAISDPDILVSQVNTIRQTYGSMAGKVLSEAAGEDPALQSLSAMSFVKDQKTMGLIAENAKLQKSIEEAYKAKMGGSTSYVSAIKTQVSMNESVAELASVVNATYGASGTPLLNSIYEQVSTEAMKRATNGLSSKDAIKEAADAIISNTLRPVSNGTSTVLVPMSYGESFPDHVENWLAQKTTPAELKKFNLGGLEGKDADLKISRAAESGTFRWKPAPDMQGVYLFLGNGVAKDKDGRPIYRSFEQIKAEPVPVKKRSFFNFGG